MGYRLSMLAVIFFSVAVTPNAVGQEVILGTADLVQGILARAENPFSGRMTYRLHLSSGGSHAPEVAYVLTFSGPSWRLKSRVKASEVPAMRQQGTKLVEDTGPPVQGFLEKDQVSHHGKYVELKRTPQDGGSVRDVVRIEHERPLMPVSSPYPPFFAGTFWYESTRKFLAARKDKAARKAPVTVNGVLCQVIEWEVSPDQIADAFYSVNELIDRGGILRVYVAPEKGFALPRFEYVGNDGKVGLAFDSWDLKEYSDGIFIPQRCRRQVYDSQGPGFFSEYRFDKIQYINQVIPDSEFVIPLPPGSHVTDWRSESGSVNFEIQKEGPVPQDLEDVIAIAAPRFWGWNWHSAFVLGLAIGLGAFGVLLLCRHLRLKRGPT